MASAVSVWFRLCLGRGVGIYQLINLDSNYMCVIHFASKMDYHLGFLEKL